MSHHLNKFLPISFFFPTALIRVPAKVYPITPVRAITIEFIYTVAFKMTCNKIYINIPSYSLSDLTYRRADTRKLNCVIANGFHNVIRIRPRTLQHDTD